MLIYARACVLDGLVLTVASSARKRSPVRSASPLHAPVEFRSGFTPQLQYQDRRREQFASQGGTKESLSPFNPVTSLSARWLLDLLATIDISPTKHCLLLFSPYPSSLRRNRCPHHSVLASASACLYIAGPIFGSSPVMDHSRAFYWRREAQSLPDVSNSRNATRTRIFNLVQTSPLVSSTSSFSLSSRPSTENQALLSQWILFAPVESRPEI
ncbi:hypothetical protein BDV93DRAFT_366214 [Ceratobasidium sp. AG-I]|nr:hypothetical protein BDV93DRAFT_366214 [Ceratobasidium sp. AG-I]